MKRTYFLPALLIATLFSCKKDSNPPSPILSDPNKPTLNDFFSANASSPQTFTLDASLTQTISGAKGAIISSQPGSFITKTGFVVSGNIELSVTEIFSKKDMILNRAQTMTESEALISAGGLRLSAKQNEQELILKPGKPLSVKIPAGTSPSYSMQVYYGKPDVNSNVYWTPATFNSSAPPVLDTTNVINPYYYSFSSDSLNWINCARVYTSTGPGTNFTITVHGNYNADNTAIFLAFTDINGVAMLTGNGQTYTNNYQVPIGAKATVVAISRISGNFYASYTPVTLTNGFIQDINLTPTNEAEILSKLNSL